MLLVVMSCSFGMAQENEDIFNIYFKQDFEDDSPGVYDYDEFLEDWNNPAWSDPRREYWYTYGQILIVDTNDNKFLRHITKTGEASTNDKHGMQWWSKLGKAYDEVYFSYRLRLRSGFEPVLSGKFCGMKGGPEFRVDNPPGYDDGFVQMMSWTYHPDLVEYIYHQDQPTSSGQPFALKYGLPTGVWITITVRMVMNTVSNGYGLNDGLCETFINGVLQHQITGLRYRNHEYIGVEDLLITNFFGGDPTPEWAAKRDEYADFDDFYVFTYKSGIDVPHGTTPSAKDRILIMPGSSYDIPAPEPVDRDADTNIIKIEAYGDDLDGVHAHFQLLVNDEFIGETDVSTSASTYSFNPVSPAGNNDTIYILFTNDEYIAGLGDRNLYINSITYNGYTYYPGADNVVYVFEGAEGIKIFQGTSDLYYGGGLVLFTGETEVDPSLLQPVFQNSEQFANTAPVILNQSFLCADTLKNEMLIGQIVASDNETDQTLSYRILSGNTSGAFSINTSTGEISVANAAYLLNNDQFFLEVMIKDNHPLSKSDTGNIIININHVIKSVTKSTVYYIDPSNINDLSEDGSMAHPFDSWTDINWESGNSYLQKRGTIAYEKKINIGASNITIGAYGEGDIPLIRSQAKDFAMRAYERKNITINNLHLIAEEAVSCIYFLGSTCDSISINNCTFESSSNGIRIIEGKTFDISYNTFIGCVDAIYSFAEDNRIYYNVFRENNTAINVNSYLSKASIFNNVFYYNSTGVSASYSELVIYNNIFYLEEQNNQALNYNFDKLVSDNNIYFPEQDGFININNVNYRSLQEYQSSTGLDMNSFTQDPQFIDVYNNNFGLKSTSPAIDAGKDLGVTVDFFGTAVPYGSATDIGLKETMEARTVTGITDNFESVTGADGPMVYPNPTNGIIQVSYDVSSTTDMEVIIQDISGRTVYYDHIPGGNSSYRTEIDITSQSTGIYLIFFHVCGKSFMKKIIKH